MPKGPVFQKLDYERALRIAPAFVLAILCLGLFAWAAHAADPAAANGAEAVTGEAPRRVVSLVPDATEIIRGLGAGGSLAAVTVEDEPPPGSGCRIITGGPAAPSPEVVKTIQPDLLIVSAENREASALRASKECRILSVESSSISDLYANIRLLGSIFGKSGKAEEIVDRIRGELALIAQKVERFPDGSKKRVARIIGAEGDSLTVPGDDSFQDEFIRLAGGIPPVFGRRGHEVSITLDEWKRFDPEAIYVSCEKRAEIDRLLSRPGWNEVQAVKEGRVFSFPSDMADRLSVRTGAFVAWLASTVYDDEFASERCQVLGEKCLRAHRIEIALPCVRSARLEESTICDFTNKTLIVELSEPMAVLSTLEGERKRISTVGNHYFPPPCWSVEYRQGYDKFKKRALKTIGKSETGGCFLFTGADMGNLSVRKEQFRDMTVYALVTAGVESNAMRASVDEGLFYEPGTINILLLTNMKLSPRAMARAIITATEAKTAAIQDLDVRSTASPAKSQATGTGTDEVLVAEGRGRLIDNTGGHCKLGELIAKAVYGGVTEAVLMQNGIAPDRSVFRRLHERRIDIREILANCNLPDDGAGGRRRLARLEEILLDPRYASFVESSFALSDANERGLLSSLDSYRSWCRGVAEEIAGERIETWTDFVASNEVPVVMRMSFDALLNGLAARERRAANVSANPSR